MRMWQGQHPQHPVFEESDGDQVAEQINEDGCDHAAGDIFILSLQLEKDRQYVPHDDSRNANQMYTLLIFFVTVNRGFQAPGSHISQNNTHTANVTASIRAKETGHLPPLLKP